MKRTVKDPQNTESKNLNGLILFWLIIIFSLLTLSGCGGCNCYVRSLEEDGVKADYVRIESCVAGNIYESTTNSSFSGANCLYKSSGCLGCGGKTESCYVCIASENSVSAFVCGDTSSQQEIVIGCFEGCLCISCNDDNGAAYLLPEFVEAAEYLS